MLLFASGLQNVARGKVRCALQCSCCPHLVMVTVTFVRMQSKSHSKNEVPGTVCHVYTDTCLQHVGMRLVIRRSFGKYGLLKDVEIDTNRGEMKMYSVFVATNVVRIVTR